MRDAVVTEWRAGWCLPKPGRVANYARARLSPPRIDAGLASAVLALFDLKIDEEPSNLAFGWRNRNVLVRSTDGPKVLKIYPERWSHPAIVYEHSILEHLSGLEFPSVRLNRTTEGRTAVEHDKHWFAVFDFEPGMTRAACYVSQSTRRRLLVIAGRTLAMLHDSLREFEPEGRHHLGFGSMTQDRDRNLSWLLRQLDELPEKTGDASDVAVREDLSWLISRASSVAEQLVRLEERLHRAGLPRVVIHGDYGIHNILYQADGTAVVHDFELARLEWRLIDVLTAAARPRAGPLRRAFVHAYDSHNEISDTELAHVSEIWQDYRLRGAVHSWYSFCEFGGERRLRVARSRIEEADRAFEQGVTPWV